MHGLLAGGEDAAVSATLVCDVCRTPKDSTTHYTLSYQAREPGHPTRKWRKHSGTIDLCDGCRERVTHDGRSSAHKVAAIQRIEFGKTSR
jgi:hypothetical protein